MPSEEQSSSQFFRRFVSVFRKVSSKGIMAPSAIRTKQSVCGEGISYKHSIIDLLTFVKIDLLNVSNNVGVSS